MRAPATQKITRAIRRLVQIAAYLVQVPPERAADRHAHRPAELGGGDVLPDDPPVSGLQRLQPLPHRFIA